MAWIWCHHGCGVGQRLQLPFSPGPGTSICHRCSSKKKGKKKKGWPLFGGTIWPVWVLSPTNLPMNLFVVYLSSPYFWSFSFYGISEASLKMLHNVSRARCFLSKNLESVEFWNNLIHGWPVSISNISDSKCILFLAPISPFSTSPETNWLSNTSVPLWHWKHLWLECRLNPDWDLNP